MKALLIFVFVISMLFSGCSITGRHRYDVNTRVVLSAQTAETAFNPSATSISVIDYPLEHALCSADVVVEGEVTEIGEVSSELLLDGLPFKIIYTPYTIRVKSVWFGECEEKEITLLVQGDENTGVSKPHLRDQGIFILREYYNETYALARAETAIFIKNPPNNLIYAFSDDKESMAFDGETVASFKKSLQAILDNIANTGGKNGYLLSGKVGKPYTEAYNASVQSSEK